MLQQLNHLTDLRWLLLEGWPTFPTSLSLYQHEVEGFGLREDSQFIHLSRCDVMLFMTSPGGQYTVDTLICAPKEQRELFQNLVSEIAMVMPDPINFRHIDLISRWFLVSPGISLGVRLCGPHNLIQLEPLRGRMSAGNWRPGSGHEWSQLSHASHLHPKQTKFLFPQSQVGWGGARTWRG